MMIAGSPSGTNSSLIPTGLVIGGRSLDLYYSPSELEQAIASFVRCYNEQCYHESLDNVTPADMYFGRYIAVTTQREIIKQQTLQQRLEHHLQAALYSE